jgi:hypothetical protein
LEFVVVVAVVFVVAVAFADSVVFAVAIAVVLVFSPDNIPVVDEDQYIGIVVAVAVVDVVGAIVQMIQLVPFLLVQVFVVVSCICFDLGESTRHWEQYE